MRLTARGPLAFLAWVVFGACSSSPQAGGAGSSTSWLRSCKTTAGCDSGLECTCGLCVRSCSDSAPCGTQPNTRCAPTDEGIGKAVCQLASTTDAPGGLCLPECDAEHPCASGLSCVGGACVPGSLTTSACGLGATVSLRASAEPVQARHGMFFMNGFYEPVSYTEKPANWVDPVTPVTFVATVRDSAGAPIRDCPVVWQTEADSGWAYADATTTNSQGEVSAAWVAGAATQQTLSVALEGPAGAVARAALAGEARAHSEAPTFPDPAVAQTSVSPTLVFLDYPLDARADAVQVQLTPVTFPRETYYAAVAWDGFFTGLQNTSAEDASVGSVPDTNRILIASVWNVPEGDALLLWNDPEVYCGPHTQDAGGIRCDFSAAWELGTAATITTEYRVLASGDAAPSDYASLAYATDACASSAGCTDYTVFLQPAGAAAPRRLVAYRYARAVPPTHFFSHIDVFSPGAQAMQSCLEQSSSQVLVSAAEYISGQYSPIDSPQMGARYSTWENIVCANYGAVKQGSQVLLATGGPAPLSRPLLPNESRRPLQ